VSRVSDIKFTEARQPKSTIAIDADVARLIRRVVNYEGRRMSAVLHDMIAVYAKSRGWEVDYAGDDDGSSLADEGPIMERGSVLEGPATRALEEQDRGVAERSGATAPPKRMRPPRSAP